MTFCLIFITAVGNLQNRPMFLLSCQNQVPVIKPPFIQYHMLQILKTTFLLCLLSVIGCSENELPPIVPPSESANISIYHTGGGDVSVVPEFGVCMMGGGLESDEAMRSFLQLANGGNVVVIRASGSDGYNDYFMNQLSTSIASVTTLVFEERNAPTEILQYLNDAEAIWIAGGNQQKYIDYWKNNDVQQALQSAIERGIPIGGTSAGMAVLGEYFWTGKNIETDFLRIPYLMNVITDTHYSARNRSTRHLSWIGELNSKGIAADEQTAICFNENGIASIYTDEGVTGKAFFISPDSNIVEISGTPQGSSTFDLNNWSETISTPNQGL